MIPGASQLLGLRNALRHGATPAAAGLASRLTAFGLLIALVAAGFGAAVAASATALETIKWVGVVYLAWLGVTSLWQARRGGGATEFGAPRPVPSGWRPVVTGEFLVALTNPKALLLFAALLPQFTGGQADRAPLQLGLLGLAYLVIEGLVGLLYILAGRRLRGGGISARVQRRVDAGSGVLFLGLSGLLAAEDVA
nr:LysE family transporter [Kineosporia rhizophila]